MSLSTSYGLSNMLKEGHKHFSGLEEALLRNINACKEISKLTKTSLGPNGMKKMVINHIEKIFVTSDAATIMKELEVQHPAAKMIVMASKMQENECGDGTNFVISFAGELLTQAESLIKMGLHPAQIISGYELALNKTIDIFQSGKLNVFEIENPFEEEKVKIAIKSSICSKLQYNADFFANLVAKTCTQILPKKVENFDIEYIRVAKILGGSINDSFSMKGFVLTRNAEGSIKSVVKPKIAVYGIILDPQQSDTKGTVLMKNATDLLNYSKSEEKLAEDLVKSIAEVGVNLVLSGGSISEIVLHYLEKYKIMVVRLTSKFDLKRLCKALGATALARLGAPIPEEMGFCDEVHVEEIGSEKVTIFTKDSEFCSLSTIILRGSTMNLMDDIERALDDGVNCFRCLIKEGRFCPGAGSTEMILTNILEEESKKLIDLNQYSFNRFAKSFEIIPTILSDNAGLNSYETLSQMSSLNRKEPHGISIDDQKVLPISEMKVYDHMDTKLWAIKLAADAAITILKIDQIIIAKPAGGPKLDGQKEGWDNED